MFATLIKIVLGIVVGLIIINWLVGGQTEIICPDEPTSSVERPERCR